MPLNALIVEQQASPRQLWIVAGLAALLLALPLAIFPVASQPLAALPYMAGIYGCCIAVIDFATFLLLRTHRNVPRSHHIVAAAYLFSGVMAVLHILHFPGGILPGVTLMGHGDVVGWLFIVWHIGFPSLLLWAVLSEQHRSGPPAGNSGRGVLPFVVLLILASVAGSYALTLPVYFPGGGTTFAMRATVSSYGAAATSILAVVLIWRAGLMQRSMFAWLALILVADTVGLLISTWSGGRYTVGWYAFRVERLLASLVVLTLLARHFVQVQGSLTTTIGELQQRTEALHAEMH